MRYKSVIFNDYELDNLLVGRKNILSAKKALILYFMTMPGLNEYDIVYLPEFIFEDDNLAKSIQNIFPRIGISVTSKLLNPESKSLDYSSNPLNEIKEIHKKYPIHGIHYPISFGSRSIQKSPKHDEYIIHSQYNWVNVILVMEWCKSQNISLMVEPNLYFQENSSEDFYVHMRQIFWEGIEIFRRLNRKFSDIILVVKPFYPKLKGLKDMQILDPVNIANSTLRCINESLTKERMEIMIKPVREFGISSYMKYVKFFKDYNKDNTINCLITVDCLKEYVKEWDFKESNLELAQTSFLNNFL